MANKIKLKRGLKTNIPKLETGEPAFITDTCELFIGSGSGNVNMNGSQWYTGTEMSGTSATTGAYSYSACPLVKLGDIYLNTSNGNVYQCTTAGSGASAKWTYKGNIRGKGISSTSVTYQSGMSGTNAPTGTWLSSVPSVQQGGYLWTKVVVTYTDNTVSTSYSVARQGVNGSSGLDPILGTYSAEHGSEEGYVFFSKSILSGEPYCNPEGPFMFYLKTDSSLSSTAKYPYYCDIDNGGGSFVGIHGGTSYVNGNSLYLCKYLGGSWSDDGSRIDGDVGVIQKIG